VHGAATAGCGCACMRRAGLKPAPVNSNECEAGFVRIETEAACNKANTFIGLSGPVIVETESIMPRGCYLSLDSPPAVFFNNDRVGSGESTSKLLCVPAPTGAPRRISRVLLPSNKSVLICHLHNTEGVLQSTLRYSRGAVPGVLRVLAGDTVSRMHARSHGDQHIPRIVITLQE
jgi:hypothetical protein